MKLNQLSVFLENKPGQLKEVCTLLAGAKINILTLTLADTKQFGILRLILEEWERAKKILEEGGFAVNIAEVLAFEVPDRPGGLAELLDIFEAANLNLEYMYAFTARHGDKAIIIFRLDDPDAALRELQAHKVNLVPGIDLYARVK